MRRGFFGGPFSGGGPSWVHWLFVFLIVVAIVAGVWLIVRLWMTRPPGTGWRAAPPPPPNPALTELDLRYARGEIGREEFLQRRADLLGHAAPPHPPGAPPPPAP